MTTFVDTNILVYAEDLDAGERHEKARSIVLDLWDSAAGVVSIQVLQEFYVTVTRKMKNPLSPEAALTIVEEYLSWQVVHNTGSLLLDGIRLAKSAQLSFWDALVVQAAMSANCDCLLTEDLTHGQRFGELNVANPFL